MRSFLPIWLVDVADLARKEQVVDFLSRWDVIVSFPVILFPSYMVAGYVRDGKLSCALERLGAEPTSVQIGYPSPTLRSSNVQAFVDACAKALTRLKFD